MAGLQKSRAVGRKQKNRANAEICAEIEAVEVDAESCAGVDAEMERRAEPCADDFAEKIAPIQKHMQIQNG